MIIQHCNTRNWIVSLNIHIIPFTKLHECTTINIDVIPEKIWCGLLPLECQQILGMESGVIPNERITASSQLNADHAAIQARLNFQATSTKAGSWSARTNDVNQWLQVDLGKRQSIVTSFVTQGRNGVSQWVTKYKLQYSDNGVHFQYYRQRGQTSNTVRRFSLTNIPMF